ncbi:MAG: hypothetical protein EAZ12_03280 [Sphingobacteriia bacterium]|nr:MAG: hypothetical protein EAZ12_03280 [Sphingobacteriia bacterium]
MKKLFVVLAMFLFTTTYAQKFEAAMEKGMIQFKDAKSPDEMMATSAFFERVADAEKDKWLPYYYAAQTQILAAWMNPKSDKDKVAEKVNALILKAELLSPNNSEIYCLKQMTAVMQLTVDAMSRWQSYGAIASEAIAKAKAADATNPRPYMLEGQYLMNVPEAFGGGKAVAKKILEKSLSMFETFKPASPFHPNWGKEQATTSLAACQ